jgi:hypothetical protein
MSQPSNQSLGAAGLGATAGGAAISAFGNISSGFAQSSMFNYNAAIANLNQQIDSQNAEFASQTGEQNAAQSGLKTGQQIGQTKVAQASSGFDVRSGSNLQVRDSEHQLGEIDQGIIRSNAAKTAYGWEEQGAVAGAQASVDQFAAKNSITAGLLGGASSVLQGGGSVASQWLSGNRVGLWGQQGAGSTTDDNIGA